jgi:hypothetical protein
MPKPELRLVSPVGTIETRLKQLDETVGLSAEQQKHIQGVLERNDKSMKAALTAFRADPAKENRKKLSALITMKTLHQVEPRTPLTAGQLGVTQNENGGFTISVPGSYYLTASFGVPTGSGIRVEADFVTLDLNGMNVYGYGSPASGAGVEVVGFRKGLTVRNGFIVGATTTSGTAAPFTYASGGFLTGVLSDAAGPAGSTSAATIENLDVRGCAGFGLNVLGGKYVNCNVDGCAAGGIGGMHAEGCTVTRCGGNGLLVNMARRCEVRNCNATGMIVGTAEQCIVTDCVDIGIWAWGSSISGQVGTTPASFPSSASPHRFYRVEAKRPLATP